MAAALAIKRHVNSKPNFTANVSALRENKLKLIIPLARTGR